MLIIDEKLLAIDEAIERLLAALLKEPVVETYLEKKALVETDEGLQAKLAYLAENEAYLPYRKELQELKESLIFEEKIYAFRLAENDLQAFLSDLTKELAETLSDSIIVDENLPLKKGGHHGRHHTKS